MKNGLNFFFVLLLIALVEVFLPSKASGQTATNKSQQLIALCSAIQERRWQNALELIEAGAPVTNTDSSERSPLATLVERWFGPEEDYALRVRLLGQILNGGADPFVSGDNGFYPRGDLAIVEEALRKADSSLGDIMLTNRSSVLRRTPRGDTALHLAAQSMRTNIISILLAAGFNVNQTNNDGLTPLQAVASSGLKGTFIFTNDKAPFFLRQNNNKGRVGPSLPDMAEFLLSQGAKLDSCSAAGMGMTTHLSALLRTNPVSVNLRDSFDRTPLHYAAFACQTNIVPLLLHAGADPSRRTSKPIPQTSNQKQIAAGSTPLHFACLRESPGIIQMLLKAGVSPAQADADGNTPLHLAVPWRTNCAALLIEAHAPLNVTNHAGKTPLHLAVESGSTGNIELLLKSKARVDVGLDRNTLLHVAANQGRAKNLQSSPDFWLAERGAQSIPVLLRHGLPVDGRDSEGRTPLQCAVTALNWKAMNLLLAEGADINASDAEANTALHQLATNRRDQPDTMEWPPRLPKTNEVVTAGQRGVGTVSTNVSVTAWLLEHGANPNLTNKEGRTPLELVCSHPWGYWDMNMASNRVGLLLKAGAKTSSLSSNSQSFFHRVAGNIAPAETP